MPWPANRAELVGVNSFGIGGSNAHVLLGSASSFGLGKQHVVSKQSSPTPQLLLFSAKHPEPLRQTISNHESYHMSHPDSLSDMSYSLAMKREKLNHRAFCVTNGEDDWASSRTHRVGNTAQPKLIFTFSGQGAQWARMGEELIFNVPTFRQSIENMDKVLQALPECPKWKLIDIITAPKKTSRLSQAELSQPCCTAIQVALVDILREYNVRPDAVVGHSSGEIGAAYACGSITAEEAILVAFYRGHVMLQDATILGGMAAIGLGPDQVEPYLQDGVVIGCENSPDSTTLTGDKHVLEKVMQNIKEANPDTLVRALQVDRAYHSHHMEAIAPHYMSLMVKKIHPTSSQVPFYSSVSCDSSPDHILLGPEYWVRNLLSPVRFSTAVGKILETIETPKVFVELGPHSALAGPIRQILAKHKSKDGYTNTLSRGKDSQAELLKSIGELWLVDYPVNLSAIVGKGDFLTDLPLYPWHYEETMWYESRLSKEWRLREYPHHDILGSRILESTDQNPSWRNILRLDVVPWIKEHEVASDIVFPGVGYICMAGEAIRQLTGSTDFTARRVHIKTALVMQQGNDMEVVTQLQLVPLTNVLDSDWYNFSVSSCQKGIWIKHVHGQVSAGSEHPRVVPDCGDLPRKLSRQTWYRKMRAMGLNYGSRFMGLNDMTAHPIQRKLSASITNDIREGESTYAVHPVTLDCLLQALIPTSFNGLTRRFKHLAIPTYIEEIYVRPPKSNEMTIHAVADAQNQAGLSRDVFALCQGQVVIDMQGVQMSALGDSDDAAGQDPHAAVELLWKEDLRLVDASKLIQRDKDRTQLHSKLDNFAVACMLETVNKLSDIRPTRLHLSHYLTWLRDHTANMSATDDISSLYAELANTEASFTATAIYRIMTSCQGIFTGEIDELSLLLEDGVLTELYNFMQNSRYSDFIDLAGHEKPNLKVLEIGSGTGGTTATILPDLKSAYGERMYNTYTFTDISPGFFPGAKDRFKEYPGMEYAILDISKDPLEQGFVAGQYDLIIACNVLHATPNIQETLAHVRKLLHPRGRLFLQELSPLTKWINFVMGVLPGWWLGEADNRYPEPYIPRERWQVELLRAGFNGIDAVSFDGYLNNNIIATPVEPDPRPKHITLLHSDDMAPAEQQVLYHLEADGYTVDHHPVSTGGLPAVGRDIVCTLDLNEPFFHGLEQDRFEAFKTMLSNIEDAGIFWVTASGQLNCKDPRYAMVIGVARVLRTERSLDFATLELEDFDESSLRAVPAVLQQFQRRLAEPDVSPTTEWALVEGQILTSRYHYIQVAEELKDASDELAIRKLEIRRPGLADSLYWQQFPSRHLENDEVQVDVKAVGLNFKDILIAMGVITEESSIGRGLGYEASGIVTKLGPDVKTLNVGDRIIMSSSGSFTTTHHLSEKLCAKMPDGLSFTDGATMSAAYSTAILCLIDAAKLRKGESVLIHSATGGVGIAAINIAKMIGAEIYCSVGSQEKIEYLMQHFDIPRHHIFNSRDTSFFPAVMKATAGRGVDAVLNSLSGQLLHASWKCVAEFGTFVEIGRRDFVGQGNLEMQLFEPNRTFIGFDLLLFSKKRPDVVQDVMRRVMSFYGQGLIQPIKPMTEFPATQIAEPFRYIQKGQHIGKVVVTMPEDVRDLDLDKTRSSLILRPDRAYLFVGGLGGLGRAMSTWLTEKGAKHIIFLSRSAGSIPADDPFVKELAALGCTATMVSGDVCNYTDVVRAIKAASIPVAGVFQASMVLRDQALVDMSWEEWLAAVQPKVQGTWNLHNALVKEQSESLDIFFLFSSAGAMSGQWGQANYNAGNTFLDSFISFRHSLGLPASTVNIGVIEDVGYVSGNQAVLDSLRSTAQYLINESELLDSIELMLQRSTARPSAGHVQKSQIGIGLRSILPITSSKNRTIWRRDPRMLVYRNLEQNAATSSSGSDAELDQFMKELGANMTLLKSAETALRLAQEIGKTLFGFMMRSEDELDLDLSLDIIGIDSLISIEVRNWIRRKLGAEFTLLEIVRAGSVRHLGALAQEKLVKKFEARV